MLGLGCADTTRAPDASIVDSGVVADSGRLLDSGPRDTGSSDLGRVDADLPDALRDDAAAADSGPPDSGPPLDSGCVASRTALSPELIRLPPPGRPRSLHAADRLPNGQVLIAGGFSNGVDFDPDVEIFDPVTDTISAGAPRPLLQASAASVPLSDGRIFVSSGAGRPALLYDPSRGWTTTATAPNVFGQLLIPSADNRVVALGGSAGNEFSRDVYVYDPASDSWSVLLQLVTPGLGAAAVAIDERRILVLGGSSAPNMGTDLTEIIDVTSATSAPGPRLAQPRQSPSAVLLLDRRVLILEGVPTSGSQSELYDPATGSVAVEGPAPPLKIGAALVRLCDGRVAQLGGRDATSPIADTQAWLFDTSVDRWSATPATMPTRQSASATLLLDGRVLVFGGRVLGADPQPLSAYLFVPDAPQN